MNSHLTWQYQCDETAKTSFISHSHQWQLMSVMWRVGWGCGRRIVLKWTLLRYIDQDKAMVGGLRKCGTMPSFPLGSPARSLQYAGWEPTESWLYGLSSRGGQPGSVGRAPQTAATRGQWRSAAQAGDLFVGSDNNNNKKKANTLFLASNYSKGPRKTECQSKTLLIFSCLTEVSGHIAITD